MATPQVPDQPNPDFAWQGGKEEPYNMGSLQVLAEYVPTQPDLILWALSNVL